MKAFNITGLCMPDKHYMVDTGNKLAKIIELIEKGCYFTINRARQYGKTTTLSLIEKKLLSDGYVVARISFEGWGDEAFASPERFCRAFIKCVQDALRFTCDDNQYIDQWMDSDISDFISLGNHIARMCENRKVILMIDEADKAGGYRVFVHFLGVLRDKFLLKEQGRGFAFESVILAGVHDVRNIKRKMVQEGVHTPLEREQIHVSPWNIAAAFEVDMSFSPTEITTMLVEYKKEHHVIMDIDALSQAIYDYTGGYPYLVSDICKIIDEKLNKKWTSEGVQESIKIVLKEKNTLFDDLFKNLENNRDLYDFVYDILILNRRRSFTISNPVIDLGYMYGIFKEEDGAVFISNRIFEIIICEHFISKDEMKQNRSTRTGTGVLKYDVVQKGRFDMQLCLEKFSEHYAQTFNEKDISFLERHGRLVFLSYLRPLINGEGFYHIETQLSDERKMDLVVDFGSEQFIIELKIWRGEQYQIDGYEQLCGYLDKKDNDTGYMITFDFRKESKKLHKAEWIMINGKNIFEVVV